MATPTSEDGQNHVTYQVEIEPLEIEPLADEDEEPVGSNYHQLEHSFTVSNMKVRPRHVSFSDIYALSMHVCMHTHTH